MNVTSIHKKMIKSFLRFPVRFYSRTPSAILINKFTIDISVLDNSLPVSLKDAIEGPIQIIVTLVNMVMIDPLFIIPASLLSIIAIVFFVYARSAIIAAK